MFKLSKYCFFWLLRVAFGIMMECFLEINTVVKDFLKKKEKLAR